MNNELNKYRIFLFHKRNGNGQSTCKICNCITWDSMCYDLKVFCYETLVNEMIVCCNCHEHIH